jgi:suppressor for copper-sensitivity B
MRQDLDRRHVIALALAGLALPARRPAPAHAAGDSASDWSGGAQSRMRLIGGGATLDGRMLRAGVEIRLERGFKTYWRSPGDSGVPPQFNWSGSENLAGVTVYWPAPLRFQDGQGHSIGYAEEVVLPLLVTPADTSRPVTLKLDLDYAVCEKLCIPARAAARLELWPERTRQVARIAAFEARVPRRVGLGQSQGGLAVASGAVVSEGSARGLRLTISAPPDARIDDVFIEGPDMWVFGQPVLAREAGGGWTAQAMVLDKPAAAAGAAPILVTVIAGGVAIETPLSLDFGAN